MPAGAGLDVLPRPALNTSNFHARSGITVAAMAYRRGAVQSHRDEWRAEFYANSRPSTRRVPPQPPCSMQFQVRIAGSDMGRRVWPGGMGARDQAGNNAIDATRR